MGGVVFEPVYSWPTPLRQIATVLFPLTILVRMFFFLSLVAVCALTLAIAFPAAFVAHVGDYFVKTWKGEEFKW
jgi:hypothetical protein